MQTSVIFFWGSEFAQAKNLAIAARQGGLKAVTRDASVFAGDIEPCQRVVLMPSVHPTHAARIQIAYAGAGIPVERLAIEALPEARAPEVADEEKPMPVAPGELNRLSNRQLTELARIRGITFDDKPDRAEMIAAINAAKEPPS